MGNAPSMASDLYQAISMTESFEGEWKHLLMVRIEAILVSVLFGVAELRNRHSQYGEWFRPCELLNSQVQANSRINSTV
jgi:hypothetical protein